MYQVVYASDRLDITYRSDTRLLIGRWMRPVTSAEMRLGYEAMRAAAQELQCRHWLLDIRRRSHSDEETAHWVTDEFLPEVARLLHGTLYMSVLLSPTYLYEVSSRPTLAVLPTDTSRPYQIQYFTDERQANDWLSDKASK
jgi:hypothetical protein